MLDEYVIRFYYTSFFVIVNIIMNVSEKDEVPLILSLIQYIVNYKIEEKGGG